MNKWTCICIVLVCFAIAWAARGCTDASARRAEAFHKMPGSGYSITY